MLQYMHHVVCTTSMILNTGKPWRHVSTWKNVASNLKRCHCLTIERIEHQAWLLHHIHTPYALRSWCTTHILMLMTRKPSSTQSPWWCTELAPQIVCVHFWSTPIVTLQWLRFTAQYAICRIIPLANHIRGCTSIVTSVQSHEVLLCYPTEKPLMWVAHKMAFVCVVRAHACTPLHTHHSWPHVHGLLCVTSNVTSNAISYVGVKDNVFHCRHVQNHECTLVLTRAILLYAQNRNVQLDKNVCIPEGVQGNTSLLHYHVCTSVWCITSCIVAWSLCAHMDVPRYWANRCIDTILNAQRHWSLSCVIRMECLYHNRAHTMPDGGFESMRCSTNISGCWQKTRTLTPFVVFMRVPDFCVCHMCATAW